MKLEQDLYIRIKKIGIIISVIGAILLSILIKWECAVSLIIGITVSIIYIRMLIRRIRMISKCHPNKGKKVAIQGLLLRYLLILATLVVVFQSKFINPYWVMVGLMYIPLSTIIVIGRYYQYEKTG